jgi:hypothetical protein
LRDQASAEGKDCISLLNIMDAHISLLSFLSSIAASVGEKGRVSAAGGLLLLRLSRLTAFSAFIQLRRSSEPPFLLKLKSLLRGTLHCFDCDVARLPFAMTATFPSGRADFQRVRFP